MSYLLLKSLPVLNASSRAISILQFSFSSLVMIDTLCLFKNLNCQICEIARCSILLYSRFTFAGAVMRTLPSKPKTQPKKGLLAVTITLA